MRLVGDPGRRAEGAGNACPAQLFRCGVFVNKPGEAIIMHLYLAATPPSPQRLGNLSMFAAVEYSFQFHLSFYFYFAMFMNQEGSALEC